MEQLMDSSNLMLLQTGIALAIPACLATIVNFGCGKKRDQPGPRPGAAKKNITKPGAKTAASSKSKRSTSKSASKSKSGKKDSSSSKKGLSKSKRSTKSKSIDKSGKSSKGSDKSSKKSKSSKSKRETLKLPQTGPPSSQRSDKLVAASEKQKQSPSSRTAMAAEAVKDSAKQALGLDKSAKSASTQRSVSTKQSPSSAANENNNNNDNKANSNVSIAGDLTRELKMEPTALRWAEECGMQKVSLINQSNDRLAIKVKCSDNKVYRVNPVYAIIEPRQVLIVDVIRQNSSQKGDSRIVFVSTRARLLEENPKNCFKSNVKTSTMVLPLLSPPTSKISETRTCRNILSDVNTANDIADDVETAHDIISGTDTARNILSGTETARDIIDDVHTARNIIMSKQELSALSKPAEEKGWIESFLDYLFPIGSAEDSNGLHKKLSTTDFHPCGVAAFGRR